MRVRKQRAGAAHAALDLVEHHQRAMRVAELPHRLEETRLGRHHAALALHGLQHDGRHTALRECLFQRRGIVEGHVAEAAGQRLVAFLVLRLRRGGDGGQRATVEGAGEGDDHALLGRPALRCGPLAHELDGGLVGLRTRIAQENAFRERRVAHELGGKS